jgi:hypothetical protein
MMGGLQVGSCPISTNPVNNIAILMIDTAHAEAPLSSGIAVASFFCVDIFSLEMMNAGYRTSSKSTTAEKIELETARPTLMLGSLQDPVPGTASHWYETG